MIKNKLAYFLIVTTTFFGCQKEGQKTENLATIEGSFEQFWQKMNTNYVYWDIDTTNWDNVHDKYLPLFANLDLTNPADKNIRAANYYNDITNGLIDGHYYIQFVQPNMAAYNPYPSFTRKKNLPGFYYPFLYHQVDTAYLSHYTLILDNKYINNGVPLITLFGTINNNILYFSFNNFNLFKAYQAGSTTKTNLDTLFYYLESNPNNYKGMIFDVRSNQGGDINDLNFLLGRLTNKKIVFGSTQAKMNTGRVSYLPWIDSYINPVAVKNIPNFPIAVLTDKISASMSEIFTMALKSMGSTIIGDTTWGATNPVLNEDVYNSGSFIVSNFCTVTAASVRFRYIDNKIYEGKGFPPDILAPYNKDSLQKGSDLALKKAIDFLK